MTRFFVTFLVKERSAQFERRVDNIVFAIGLTAAGGSVVLALLSPLFSTN